MRWRRSLLVWLRGNTTKTTSFELAAANETITETRELLAVKREQAREPYARRNIARQQIETARNEPRNHDILATAQRRAHPTPLQQQRTTRTGIEIDL